MAAVSSCEPWAHKWAVSAYSIAAPTIEPDDADVKAVLAEVDVFWTGGAAFAYRSTHTVNFHFNRRSYAGNTDVTLH